MPSRTARRRHPRRYSSEMPRSRSSRLRISLPTRVLTTRTLAHEILARFVHLKPLRYARAVLLPRLQEFHVTCRDRLAYRSDTCCTAATCRLRHVARLLCRCRHAHFKHAAMLLVAVTLRCVDFEKNREEKEYRQSHLIYCILHVFHPACAAS